MPWPHPKAVAVPFHRPEVKGGVATPQLPRREMCRNGCNVRHTDERHICKYKAVRAQHPVGLGAMGLPDARDRLRDRFPDVRDRFRA